MLALCLAIWKIRFDIDNFARNSLSVSNLIVQGFGPLYLGFLFFHVLYFLKDKACVQDIWVTEPAHSLAR